MAPSAKSMLVLTPGEVHSVKTIIIRNPTKTDIIVKMKVSDPAGLELEVNKAIIEARKYLAVNLVCHEKALSAKGHNTHCIDFYARPVTPFNQTALRTWLTSEKVEKPHELARSLKISITNKEFSANMVVIDLPGAACLIESVPQAIAAQLDSDTITSINIEADTNTAGKFDRCDFFIPEYQKSLRVPNCSLRQKSVKMPTSTPKEENALKEQERCSLFAPLLDTLFPPTVPTQA